MEPHSLKAHTAKLIEDYGTPQVLDVEHSIRVYKPTLTGSDSPASYYIRPPSGMTADALVEWFESVPRFREFKLTLVAIHGLDTYHQPLISTDEYAKKHFHDNQARILRVTGQSDAAIEAMAVFIEALKKPFDVDLFPNHGDFLVSEYKPPQEGRASVAKLLFRPANHGLLMKAERLVNIHLDEHYLGKEIVASRHATRDQPPELVLATTHNATSDGSNYLKALVESLPRATPEEVVDITELAQRSTVQTTTVTPAQTRFATPQTAKTSLSPKALNTMALASLADVMRVSRFADGAEIKVEQRDPRIEVQFPRSISSLWMSTKFQEKTHIPELARFCIGVKCDPSLREGWSVIYNYDAKSGTLHIRTIETGASIVTGWKVVAN